MGSLIGGGFFVTWLCCIVIAGMVGQRKGSGLVGALLGLVFGPLGVAFSIAMIGARCDCPFCCELVRFKATKCPHCHSVLAAPGTAKPRVTFVDENGKAV